MESQRHESMLYIQSKEIVQVVVLRRKLFWCGIRYHLISIFHDLL